MNVALASGMDGWKCDGTDPYIMEVPDAQWYAGTNVSHRTYADAYYGDFFDYTQTVNGDECLIMSRPVDGAQYHTPLYLPFSPRRVVFSGWTGDDDADFAGLRSAIFKFLLSAEATYMNYGSDIGGYRYDSNYPLGRSSESFIRWAEVCAFVPLMENGGRGEHRPWMFDAPGSTTIVDTYRKFVDAHYELNPYLMTIGTFAYYNGTSSLTPVIRVKPTDTIPPGFDFYLGTEFVVFPMVYNDTVREISFPGTNATTYSSYWDPREVFRGGRNVTYPCPLTTLPVFIVGGAMVPLRVVRGLTGRGTSHFSSALTVLVSRPEAGQTVVREVREFKSGGLMLTYTFTPVVGDLPGVLELTSSAFSPRRSPPTNPRRVVAKRVEHAEYNDLIFVVEGVCFDGELRILQQIHTNGETVELTKATSLDHLTQLEGGFYYDAYLTRLTIHPAMAKQGVRLWVSENSFRLCQVIEDLLM